MNPPLPAAADVRLSVTDVVTGLDLPWDLTFAPDGTMLYDQRGGVLSARLTNGTIKQISADFGDLLVFAEVGLMGLQVDPDFSTNRLLYTCQGYRVGATQDVRVIKWQINGDYSAATRVGDPIVTGIQATGRHGGCRLRFDNDKLLYVSTGDAAVGSNPQDLTSLNGKVLRVTTTGAPALGNPFGSSPNANTRLIYTYGHRNVQGLSLRPGTNDMWAVEQGTDTDDEVNRLVAGRNYGYDPVPGYDETVPMTDLTRPSAQPAVFSTGFPTLALSGGAWLSGSAWGRWNGSFVAAALKATSVRVLTISGTDNLAMVESPPELQTTYGRLRSPQLGPDGALYLTTSNGGGQDRIIRVAPRSTPADTRCQGAAYTPASPVAAVQTGASTTAYAIGTDNAIYYRSMDAGATYRTLGGVLRYGPGVVTWDGSRTDLFAIGNTGNLLHRWGIGDSWPGGWENLGGVLTSSPTAISFAPGTLEVFARGRDNALWTIRWSSAGWSTWTSLGGVLSGAPGAAVDPDTGVARLAVRGADGRSYEMTRSAGGAGTGFQGPGATTCSAPAYATRVGDGQLFTLGRVSTDGAPEVVSPGGTQALGGSVLGSIALVTAGRTGFAVFARALNGELWTYDARTGPGGWRSLGGQII